jgi:hypothetical protein
MRGIFRGFCRPDVIVLTLWVASGGPETIGVLLREAWRASPASGVNLSRVPAVLCARERKNGRRDAKSLPEGCGSRACYISTRTLGQLARRHSVSLCAASESRFSSAGASPQGCDKQTAADGLPAGPIGGRVSRSDKVLEGQQPQPRASSPEFLDLVGFALGAPYPVRVLALSGPDRAGSPRGAYRQ